MVTWEKKQHLYLIPVPNCQFNIFTGFFKEPGSGSVFRIRILKAIEHEFNTDSDPKHCPSVPNVFQLLCSSGAAAVKSWNTPRSGQVFCRFHSFFRMYFEQSLLSHIQIFPTAKMNGARKSQFYFFSLKLTLVYNTPFLSVKQLNCEELGFWVLP